MSGEVEVVLCQAITRDEILDEDIEGFERYLVQAQHHPGFTSS